MKTVRLLLIGVMLFARSAFAADNVVEVDVEMTHEPKFVIGMLVSPSGTIQKRDPKWERVSASRIIVSVPYTPAERTPDTLATALVMSEDDSIVFGAMKPLGITDLSIYRLPQCPEPPVTPSLRSQVGALESLVQVRSAQRRVAQHQIDKLLGGGVGEKLHKLEQGFGLATDHKIDSELHPADLVARLVRLKNAISNYRSQAPAGE